MDKIVLFVRLFLFNISSIKNAKIINKTFNNSIIPMGSVEKLKFVKLLIISKESLRFNDRKGIQNNDIIINVKRVDIISDLPIFNFLTISL